jgi:hypothetical protein
MSTQRGHLKATDIPHRDMGNKKTSNRLVDSGEMEIIYVMREKEISVLKMSQNI